MMAAATLTADEDECEAVVSTHRTTFDWMSGQALEFDAAAMFQRLGVDVGQRFVLGPDGSYDFQFNRCIRELPDWGVRSDNGISGYCTDLMLLCRYLHEARGGKTIWQIDGSDLRAYKRARLESEDPDQQIKGVSWTRAVAALEKWVRWSLAEGILTAEPFRYIDKTVLTPTGARTIRVNLDAEADVQPDPIRFVDHEDYLLWRDVGLLGFLPDGTPDPGWRGRNGVRNALFADLLVCTGMRLGEASSLLVSELPPLAPGKGDVHVSGAIAKRRKARVVYMRRRVLRELHHYLAIERDELVQRRRMQGAYQETDSPLLVRRATRQAVLVAGARKAWAYSKLDMSKRQRLMSVDSHGRPAGPLWLWLGEGGQPLQSSTWQSAFRRANERCAKFGIDFDVHPHTLRHTFAVHMLGLLLRQTIRAMGLREDRRFTIEQIKRMLIGNPMRKLQLLMGHTREETVYLYLDVLDEAQEIVLAALAEWDEQIAVLDGIDLSSGVSR